MHHLFFILANTKKTKTFFFVLATPLVLKNSECSIFASPCNKSHPPLDRKKDMARFLSNFNKSNELSKTKGNRVLISLFNLYL